MAKTLQQFLEWALAQGSVAKYDDEGYLGECVSLINQYCYRVLGIPAKAWGHAYAWGNNTNAAVLTYFDHVSSVQAGDILVYPSSFGGGVGHIEIALDNGKAIGQNRNYSRKVAVNDVLPGYTTILRKKGGNMADEVTLTTARILAHGVIGRQGKTNNALEGKSDADLKKNQVGKELTNQYIANLYNSTEAKNFRANIGKPVSVPTDSDKKLAAIKNALGIK